MLRTPLLRLAATWLCLISIGLSGVAGSGMLVRCVDVSGRTRIEWGCARNAVGECLTSCGAVLAPADEHGRHANHLPCRDAPLEGPGPAVKSPSRSAEFLSTVHLPPAVAAATSIAAAAPACVRVHPVQRIAARPPDGLDRLRTIVLLV